MSHNHPFTIGLSACFLVASRYDGKINNNEDVKNFLKKLEENNINIIPFCPEQLGGMATPRDPAERHGNKVITNKGEDVTAYFTSGAENVLTIAKATNMKAAILKNKSPSCGRGTQYDGTFTKTLISGDGVTTELLQRNGIKVVTETQLDELTDWLKEKYNINF